LFITVNSKNPQWFGLQECNLIKIHLHAIDLSTMNLKKLYKKTTTTKKTTEVHQLVPLGQ